jgi:hypothetical protein
MLHLMTVLTGDEKIATFMLTNSANAVAPQFCSHAPATRDHSRLSSTADSLRPKVRIPRGRLVLLPEHTTAANFGLVLLSSWRKILRGSFAFTHSGRNFNRASSTPPIAKATMWLTGRSYVYKSTTRARAIHRIVTGLGTSMVSVADALPVREESRCGAPR